ncbi:hypothetical protein HAZT_HAZT007339 [Hyalella azteca]|uniref:eRF1/Pelota-like N-terminal domain-containing protein n=1 Tax=Hyalella azteca TaxID=294128 RepID=A0A6A0HE54_HYAAZ|nr:hypothetical protein HAZT_HAZT007339 [Hyalella azteca]
MDLIKILNYSLDCTSHFVLMADEGEDMWHVYNIISPGDELKATTFRKVQQETATGSTNNARRVKTTIRLQVETTDFDASACKLRSFTAPPRYHTLDVEPNRKFTVYKNEWDSITIERIENACDPTKASHITSCYFLRRFKAFLTFGKFQHAELAAITIQEGLAYVCLITSAMTVERSKIDVNIPKKGKADDSQRKKNFLKFYEQIAASVYRHLNFEVLKAVLVASPGFLREEFLNYLMKDATEKGNKQILENRSKFVLVHSSNGFKHAIREALQDPAVAQRLSDVKAAGETRSVDNAERRRYIALVEQVKNNGGDVKIFSSLHVTGEQLDQITGVAAVLRFSMPEIEEDDRGEDDP